MKTRPYVILALLGLLPLSTLDAQTPAAKGQDNAYLIPFDTERLDHRSHRFGAKMVNRIELTVANETAVAYQDVEVRVATTPEWLTISPGSLVSSPRSGPSQDDGSGQALQAGATRGFEFAFSVDDSAPTEDVHALIFEVYSGDKLVVTKQIDISVELPKELVLRGNYPNPFNPSTTIGIVQPEDGDLTLEIFDALGRQVDRVDRYGAKRGQQTISWNATTRATGVYFYRLQLRSDSGLKETRPGKMILVK